MKQFIYKVIELSRYYTRDIQDKLNALGKDGWELVNIVTNGDNSSYAEYIFKKEKLTDSDEVIG